MKNTENPLAVKFKSKEQDLQSTLPTKSIVGIRLDGRAFHTFTKQNKFRRPYDEALMDTMNKTARFIMEKALSGVMFGYAQSDEITIFFTDTVTDRSQLPFDGKVAKLLSICASAASVGFLRNMPDCEGYPMFDARLFLLDSLDEVQEYMDWRRLDARKNAVTMAAEMVATRTELHGLSNKGRLDLLKGTDYEVLPEDFMNGRLILRTNVTKNPVWVDKRTGIIKTMEISAQEWAVQPAFRDKTEEVVNSFRDTLILGGK